jgi:hypothetical protein
MARCRADVRSGSFASLWALSRSLPVSPYEQTSGTGRHVSKVRIAAIIDLPAAETQPRRAALIAATSIFFMVIIASNARFASAPPTAIASVSTRGVICHETPHLSLHQPQALSWPPLPTMAPIAVGLSLIVSGDLEREGFVMFERGTAVEADTRDTGNLEFDCEHISLLAGWVVTWCTVDGTHSAVGKGRDVKASSGLGILIVPETNRVLCHCMSFRFEPRPNRHPLPSK